MYGWDRALITERGFYISNPSGSRRLAQPGQCSPGTGARGREFLPPAFRGSRDDKAFLREELGSGIVSE